MGALLGVQHRLVDRWFGLIVAILATWRVSHLLAAEDGPFDLVARLRARAGNGMWGRLMDCPYCLSLWVAAPATVWLAGGIVEGVLLWLAISGGTCIVETGCDALRRRRELPLIDGPAAARDSDGG